MRTQGINLHVAHHCFFLPSSISSPPSPSLETKNRKRRRIWKRLKTSRRISGERLSIETILQIIDRSVKKKKKKGGERWKRRRESYALARYFRERIPFPRVTLDAPFSTRNSSREKERKRGKEREPFLWRRGGDLWMKIVDGTSVDARIFPRENWSFVGFLSNIRFGSFRARLRGSFLPIFDNVSILLSCFSGSLLVSSSYEFIVVNFYLERREI